METFHEKNNLWGHVTTKVLIIRLYSHFGIFAEIFAELLQKWRKSLISADMFNPCGYFQCHIRLWDYVPWLCCCVAGGRFSQLEGGADQSPSVVDQRVRLFQKMYFLQFFLETPL